MACGKLEGQREWRAIDGSRDLDRVQGVGRQGGRRHEECLVGFDLVRRVTGLRQLSSGLTPAKPGRLAASK